ncbi:nuclear transport factor 2 family protein [Paenarthrobacter nicotinovorans]|uniref:nuclear transport factor 2 family protein n=1 Tax=Paenarthrobacter nicotinovorans TaxID=29320 RepID=UPI0037F41F9D
MIDDVGAIHALYTRQSHLIDTGDAAGWAATFTPDGTFLSPTYPEPVHGLEALTQFALDFANTEDGIARHHVVSTVDVTDVGVKDARARAYLLIIETPEGGPSRLARLTTLHDRLAQSGEGWKVASREVVRHDGPRSEP